MTDLQALHARAAELERARDEIREELDGVLRELAEASGNDDSFAMRFAQRMMDERDAAQRRIAELESMITSADALAESRFNEALMDASTMRDAIHRIVQDPLMSRERVQSVLLLIHEKVRNHVYAT
jgi:hypothetical protein